MINFFESSLLNIIINILWPMIFVFVLIFSVRNFYKYRGDKDKFDKSLDEKLEKGEITQEEYHRIKNRDIL
ncbi:hypothetical protein GOQ27_10540 [Clostridium sp. D2Q-11]|uniref:SHOCT domain-containing protein n=1 Tax=Anaeromonas frigoriresistens TaxID=2683708 RepID=A0A942UVP1_9FIRM|nr:hypothetical protein [Anaeromonas frigoriresistens]MBS4538905.1 hypothetical protein [Anaeromonas frigoriresistens]